MLLGAGLLLAVLAYIGSFFVVKSVVDFSEETFASATVGSGRPLDLYLDALAIDPVRKSMDVRLDVANGAGPLGTHYDETFDRNIDLRVSDGNTEENIRLRRSAPLASRVFTAGLQGAVGSYPFDRYSSRIAVSARELSSNNRRSAIPVKATVWKGVPSWTLHVAKAQPSNGPSELALDVGAHRPAPLVFFACVIYGLMVLIAMSAIAIAGLVFIGARKVEVGQVGALAGMVFALPVLRNVVPGGPPLGVLADLFILLWAEVAVAVALTLVVVTWVRRGAEQ